MKAWCCPLRTFVCCCRQTSIVWAVVVYSLGRGHVVMSWVDCLVLAVVRWGQWTIAKRHFRWVISSFILVQSSINWWWAELMLSHSWRRLIPPLPPRVPQDTPLKPLFGKMTRESARIGRGESGHDMANQLHYNIFVFLLPLHTSTSLHYGHAMPHVTDLSRQFTMSPCACHVCHQRH